jgi:hypothetical protein
MIALFANSTQLKQLNGYRFNNAVLDFAPYNNGGIVGLQVLKDPNFSEIHNQLNELERIELTSNEIN